MVHNYLRKNRLPLIACPHTRGLHLDNIIKGIADSHRITCSNSNLLDSNETHMIEEFSNALTKSLKKQSRKNKSKKKQRKIKDETKLTTAAPEKEHKKAKRAPKGTIYPCSKCSATFKMQKDLIKHYNTVHSLTRPFKCDRCESWFKTNSDRTKHIKAMHLNDYKFYCPTCNKGCYTQKKLVDHQNTHLKKEDRPYECEHCGKKFTTEKQLQLHSRTHEGLKVECELCTTRFLDKHHSYKAHMKLVHGAHVRYDCNKCLLCDKDFGEQENRPRLMAHMKENHGDVGFMCEICGRKFADVTKLESHEKNEHFRVSMVGLKQKTVDIGTDGVVSVSPELE